MLKQTVQKHVMAVNDTFTVDFEYSFSKAVNAISKSLRNGGKLIFCGNGGSAGDSQHISAEFVSKLQKDREPLAAISLTVDTSAITSIGNDYGFDNIFSRQVKALARPEDTLIVFSTSGKSQNVIMAVQTARREGISVIALTGETGLRDCEGLNVIELKVASGETARVQEIHILIGHLLCARCEREYL
tara:strand:+ start:219 stop:782 length:564 start_codon:yes stop_codon:yes gene_type:complete